MLRKSAFKLASLFIILSTLSFASISHAGKLQDAPSGEYKLDLSHASIVWKVSHFGMSNYVARFNDFDMQLNLDSEDYSKSSITATINTASLDTDYPFKEKKDFNKKLIEGKDWFNGSAFPEITFASTKLTPIDDKKATLLGNLTFLGITKPVTLDVTFNNAMASHPFANVPAIGFSATTKIKRTDWGFDKYVGNVGDEVSIDIEAEFFKKEPVASTK